MLNKKYSILVPTYNKLEYLKFTIKSILSTNFQNFELIISNDHSTDDTDIYLSNLQDHRVKIIKPPIKLTQTKNYEYMLNFASGEWITIIGDDDGVTPNFFSTLEYLTNKYPEIKILKFKRAIYYWEGVSDLYGDRVVYYENLKKKERIKNSKVQLILSILNINSAQDLPMIYTSGFVKSELIANVKKKSNNFFFHSLVPDYYSMIALCLECKKYLFSETPIFWIGVSKKSAGRKRNIYFNKNKHYSKVQKNIEINENLELSGKVSKILHKIGIPSIYLFEGLLKHPYKKKIWVNKIIRTFVYSATILSFIKLINMPFRMKVNIKNKLFCKIIFKDMKTYNLNFMLLLCFTLLLALVTSLSKIFRRFLNFFEKKLRNLISSNKPLIIVSKNREKFKNLKKVNELILKLND
mgnify:CR=1 FL=1